MAEVIITIFLVVFVVIIKKPGTRRNTTKISESISPAPKPVRPVVTPTTPANQSKETLTGFCHVIDGDTIVISKTRIRLYGIDAPEIDHPWGKKSKWTLVNLCKGKKIKVEPDGSLSHDRCVAKCYLPDGTDLSAEMVRLGMAIDWPKFSGGAYRHLEPEGIRKRHWRAAARQKGRMPPS